MTYLVYLLGIVCGMILRECIGSFPDMTPAPEPTEPEEASEE